MVRSSRLAVALGVLVFMAGWTPIASAEDQIVTLTNDLGCWYFAAPPPPYQVFLRRSGSAPEERTYFAETFLGALGPGPTGETLAARPGGVYRLGPGGLLKIFDLPSGFVPSAILSHRSGRVYVLGGTSAGNALATWNGAGEVVVEPAGGNGAITSVDLADDGCTAIQASGRVYRSNLCVSPHTWEPWIEMTNASAAFFAPNHQILIQFLRLESPIGPYTQIVQVRDTTSLAVISEYPMPRTHSVIGLGSDPGSFWTIPADCEVSDFSLRKHDLHTGELVGEQLLTTDATDDRPHFGVVERGWRAALAQQATAAVPTIHPALLLVLITALTCSALLRVR